MDWQPIATAPQDGTKILLYYRFGFRDRRVAEGQARKIDGRVMWFVRHDGAVRATHWMELPELPK
jgi:hypothetical protein